MKRDAKYLEESPTKDIRMIMEVIREVVYETRKQLPLPGFWEPIRGESDAVCTGTSAK